MNIEINTITEETKCLGYKHYDKPFPDNIFFQSCLLNTIRNNAFGSKFVNYDFKKLLDIDLLIIMDEWLIDRNFEGYPLGKLIPASMETATFRFIAKILEIPVIHVVTTFRAIPTGYMYDENQTKLYRTCYEEYLEETLKAMNISKDANVLIMPMRAADGYDILTTQAIKSTIKQLNQYANEI
jgi:hypothetical protein